MVNGRGGLLVIDGLIGVLGWRSYAVVGWARHGGLVVGWSGRGWVVREIVNVS